MDVLVYRNDYADVIDVFACNLRVVSHRCRYVVSNHHEDPGDRYCRVDDDSRLDDLISMMNAHPQNPANGTTASGDLGTTSCGATRSLGDHGQLVSLLAHLPFHQIAFDEIVAVVYRPRKEHFPPRMHFAFHGGVPWER